MLYNKDIASKPELIVLTKVDLLSDEEIARKLKLLRKINKNAMPVSIIDEKLLKEFSDYLSKANHE